MRKELDTTLTLYFDTLFPKVWRRRYRHHLALIGVGGNVGKSRRRFHKLAMMLRSNPHVTLLQTAPILKNPPFGFLPQPDFFNTLFLIDTTLSPHELLRFCLSREKRFKRVRTFKNAPRTLDLDIIFYDDIRMDTKNLTIPHPFWMERESVIIPLRYLGR